MNPSEFAKTVVKSFKEKKGVFEKHVNAENFVPTGFSRQQQALFLFYVIQLDYATKSSRLYEGALRLVGGKSNFFRPRTILKLNDAELRRILESYLRPRYINEAVFRYRKNSEKLLNDYVGNPLEIANQSSSAQEFLKKVREFRGFGPKIGNFFVRAMVNFFDLKFSDIETLLPPVDVHDVNIAYLMGFADSKEMTAKNISEVKKIWSQAAREAGVSWLVLDRALWILGSEGRPKSRRDLMELVDKRVA